MSLTMRYSVYSHAGGISCFPAKLKEEVCSVLGNLDVRPAAGAAPKIRRQVISALKQLGWSEKVAVAQGSDITVTSTKASTGLCLQTGNMARLYADLIKLETMFLEESISSAGLIVPSYETARKLGSNIAQTERLIRELQIFSKAYAVPTLIFSID